MTERTLKQLIIGVLALVVLYGATLGLSYLTRPRAETGGALATGMGHLRTDTIIGAVIQRGPGDSVVLRHGAAGWTVNGFRADPSAVDRLTSAIAAATVGDVVTRTAAGQDRLGITTAAAWKVELDGKHSSTHFLLGTAGSENGEGYIRLADEMNVHQIDAELRGTLTDGVSAYRDKTIARIDTAGVQRIVVERDGKRTDLARSKAGWVMDPSGPGKLDSSKVAQLLGGAAGLDASGFPPDSATFAGKETRKLTLLGAKGDTLVALELRGDTSSWLARKGGAPQLYQLASYTVDQLVPKREELAPPPPKK